MSPKVFFDSFSVNQIGSSAHFSQTISHSLHPQSLFKLLIQQLTEVYSAASRGRPSTTLTLAWLALLLLSPDAVVIGKWMQL